MTVVSVAQKGWWQFEENKWETFSGSYQIRKLTHIDAKTVIWKWLIVAPAASQHPLLSAALSHHCFVLLVYSTFIVCLHGTSDRPFVRPSVELCKFCYSERRIAFIDLVWLVNQSIVTTQNSKMKAAGCNSVRPSLVPSRWKLKTNNHRRVPKEILLSNTRR